MTAYQPLALGGLLALFVGVTTAVAATELVQNGGFEDPLIPQWTPGGTASGGVISPGANVHSGTYAFGFQAGTGDISQSLTTSAGSAYTVSAWVKSTNTSNTASLNLGGNTAFNCPALTTSYQQCTTTFTAQSASDVVHVLTNASSGGVFIDDVSVQLLSGPTPVPTLQVWAFIALMGLLGISGLWRMRRKSSGRMKA